MFIYSFIAYDMLWPNFSSTAHNHSSESDRIVLETTFYKWINNLKEVTQLVVKGSAYPETEVFWNLVQGFLTYSVLMFSQKYTR